LSGDIPVFGDWIGTATTKIGIYRNGLWYLDLSGNGLWDGCGVDGCFSFGGDPGDMPVTGDWTGTGTTKIGVYRNGMWLLDLNGNGILDPCGIDECSGPFGGLVGDVPVTGDWTGTGVTRIGIYRSGLWYTDLNGNGTWDGCGTDGCLGPFGAMAGDIPVTGDWTGTAVTRIGIYRNGSWYTDLDGNGIWAGCGADGCPGPFGGMPGDIPVVGKW
jgi:hypothetical protein